MNITFNVNLYDDEGDKYLDGIYLHMGENCILRVQDLKDRSSMIDNLNSIKEEIESNNLVRA